MVFLSSRISPRTSTVIFFERSPLATAAVTSAMFRTCAVRFPAIEFTLSVKSFQVPATPFTSAWPPSFPSVPTSRATRVTSEAKDRSWSTIVLMVAFNSRNSPLTSTVIFLVRSPVATAVVTSAILRTWPVRLPAIRLTLSVRSFHVPATPLTSACPPSFPSVPTSRATRVTSDANEPSWSTIVLTVVAVLRNSPCNGRPSPASAIICERSPFATAPMTRAVSNVGLTRSEIKSLTQSTDSCQAPRTSPRSARCESLPSFPTTERMRFSSSAIRWFSSLTSLKQSAIFPSMPIRWEDIRAEKSPFFSARRPSSNCLATAGTSSSVYIGPSTWSCKERLRVYRPNRFMRNLGAGRVFNPQMPVILRVGPSILQHMLALFVEKT